MMRSLLKAAVVLVLVIGTGRRRRSEPPAWRRSKVGTTLKEPVTVRCLAFCDAPVLQMSGRVRGGGGQLYAPVRVSAAQLQWTTKVSASLGGSGASPDSAGSHTCISAL